jgi:hypothetical protein
MKIFLDDFTVHNDMKSHLMKFRLCFQKCREYKISVNLEKCVFIVFLGLILGFIISKEGKIPNPKKVQTIVNTLVPTTHNKFKSLMVWFKFIDVLLRTLLLSWHQSQS